MPARQTLERLRAGYARLTPAAETAFVAGLTGATALALILLFVVLPESYSGRYANDILIFFDSADRILSGQAPNREFHSPLGPLAFLLPAFGLWIRGTFGTMMPIATAAFIAVLLPSLTYACRSRLSVAYALGAAGFALLLVAAPVNVGEMVEKTSFAMFYNRFCWASLGLLFLFLLPRRWGAWGADAAVMAALMVLMLYIKISFAAVGVLFVVGLVLLPEMRKPALVSIALAGAVALLVEIFWGQTGTYIADIGAAARASGAVRGTLGSLFRIMLENFTACALFAMILGLAVARGVRPIVLLACLYMAAAGVLLVNQNAQQYGLLSFIPAGLVATLYPTAKTTDTGWPRIAGTLLIVAIAAPIAAVSAVTLGYYTIKSARTPAGPFVERLDGMIAEEGSGHTLKPGLDAQRTVYRTGFADLEMFNMARHTTLRQPLSQPEYFRTVKDGAALLASNPRLTGKTIVFDMANPFNALADRASPVGVDAWNHAGRTLSAEAHRPAEVMFADVDVIMIPKAPMEIITNHLMRELYQPFIAEHFDLVGRSDYWNAYARKQPR